MGSSADSSAPLSAEFLALFHSHADASSRMSFERFMALALYDPQLGYYRRERLRVGYAPGTDFFTASTSGPVFGELIAAACIRLLSTAGLSPADHTFVEIGAETPLGIMTGAQHPFSAVTTLRLGEPLALSGRCIVFSNELFDAQPFRRFVFRAGAWHELGVQLRDGHLVETELSAPASPPPEALPSAAPEGYVIDAPLASVALLDAIATQPWTGLFLACDYGKSWRELTEACPAGTARAYHRHTQSNDLLAHPGEQDLTCHICWDWLAAALTRHDFAAPAIESQESFFVRHAESYIAATSTAEAARFSQKKLSLLQLLHPSHLGQKFQVLHALRPASSR